MLALAGCALAAAVLGYGYKTTSAADQEYRAAQASCERERAAAHDAPWLKFMDCDGYKITPETTYTESQKALVASYGKERNIGGFGAVAFCIAFLCSLPWAWYFMLARLREVAAAIRG